MIFSREIIRSSTFTAGGMLINDMLAPAMPGAGVDAGEGAAIPVAYGLSRSTPQILNYYVEIDDNGDEWTHRLLSVAEGLTNNVPGANDIFIGDELLSFLGTNNYELYVTGGSNSPDTAQLTKFQKLHQYRSFSKRVRSFFAISLLHFNGSEGSTTIVEETAYNHNWTCQNNADLITTHPWGGSANLDVLGAADYLTSDNWDAFNIFAESVWDIELRFRQGVLADSGIIGQSAQYGGTNYFWSIIYDNAAGKLMYQQFSETSGSYTIYFNVSGTAALSVDTWHHIRVARYDSMVYVFLDGALVTSGAYGVAPAAPPAGSTYGQAIGRAYQYDAVGPSHTLKYANAEIDEFRFVRGENLYSLTSFTPPGEEVTVPEAEYYYTRGVCDEITIIVAALDGLYDQAADGSLNSLSVNFDISYRKIGDSSWTTNNETITGKSRYTVQKQFNYSLPSRDRYEIKIIRTTPDHDDTRKQSRIHWTGLDEVLDEFLVYPNLQLVSVSLRVQDESGEVPEVRVVTNRTSIEVPTFDGQSTIMVDPTNNAYAAYDMLTNNLYGGGIDPSRFGESAWQDWIDWCNGLVAGNKRCQFNMVLSGQFSMDEALQSVENTGRTKIVMRGTRISVAIEKPKEESFMFCAGNIISGSSRLSFLPQIERSDAVEVKFNDKDNLWQSTSAFAPGANYETLGRVPRIVRLSFPGINNYEQAMREAILRQQISEGIKRSISLGTGIEGIVSMVGDVIRFAHEGNALVVGGRLAADSDGGQMRIDKKITLDSATYQGNCKIWIKKSDDTILEGDISGPFDEETEVVNTSIGSAVERFDNYIIGRATEEKYLYRLVSMQRTGQKHVKVTGLQYKESSYYHSDYESGTVAI